MSKTAIKVENLSKIYRLGEIGTGTISRDLERWFKMQVLKQEDPFLKIGETNDRLNKGISEIVYSLQDINFDINQGDAVGIIGRNGAGKSTLLKILSRVTTPSTGRINIKGRVASLLEVGTGFHPELTGRENIYLNGAMLGMRKREIDGKLDEIIDFAGVERYIDTPVKRYSSGMYVRLAFAVAAHLESEILIVDEVLAVGDAEFQKKCLGKMGEVSKHDGRTVLYVSHNLGSVSNLCNKGLLISNGKLKKIGSISEIIALYNSANQITNNKYSDLNRNSNAIYIKSCEILNNFLQLIHNEKNTLELEVVINSRIEILVSFELILKNDSGVLGYIPFGLALAINNNIKIGESKFRIEVYLPNLMAGIYYVDLVLAETGVRRIQQISDILQFEVESSVSKINGWNYGVSINEGVFVLPGNVELC